MTTINLNGATIVVNGVKFSGKNVMIKNGKVTVDGKDATPEQKDIVICVNGDISNLSVDVCASLHISGDVGNVETISGDVECGNVSGSVSSTSGDIRCKQIHGNARTISGDIIGRAS
jgi:hypothetical protein